MKPKQSTQNDQRRSDATRTHQARRLSRDRKQQRTFKQALRGG